MSDWPSPGALIGAKVHIAGDTAIPTATWRPVAFDTVDFDTAGLTTASVAKLTIPIAGYWLITAEATYAASSGGTVRGLLLRLNGTGDGYNGTALGDSRLPPAGASSDEGVCVATVHRLSVGDVLENVVNQDTGGNLNVKSTTRTFLSAVLVGT